MRQTSTWKPRQGRPATSVGSPLASFSSGQPPCGGPLGGRPPSGLLLPEAKNSDVHSCLNRPGWLSWWLNPVGSPGTTRLLGSSEYWSVFHVRLGEIAWIRLSFSATLAWMPPPYDPPTMPTTEPLASCSTSGRGSRTLVMSCWASFTSYALLSRVTQPLESPKPCAV